jgi:hypothetical protein
MDGADVAQDDTQIRHLNHFRSNLVVFWTRLVNPRRALEEISDPQQNAYNAGENADREMARSLLENHVKSKKRSNLTERTADGLAGSLIGNRRKAANSTLNKVWMGLTLCYYMIWC